MPAHTIVVPLDGSPLAERALPYAQIVARLAGARLLLVRAVLTNTVPGGDATEAAKREVRRAETFLAGVVERPHDHAVVETVAFDGNPADAILAQVRPRSAGMVVMATHGRSGLGSLLFGSVAKAVLVRSTVPILLVRAWRDDQPLRLDGPHPRILVALDGSVFAEGALPLAESMARRCGGELVLVRVVAGADDPVATDQAGEMLGAIPSAHASVLEARAYLEDMAGRVIERHSDLRVSIDVRVGAHAEMIHRASGDHMAAMVAMTTHGRTGLGAMLLGSVANDVLRHGTVPLLLIRPNALLETQADDRTPEGNPPQPKTWPHAAAATWSPT